MDPGRIAKICSLSSVQLDRYARTQDKDIYQNWVSNGQIIGCVQVGSLKQMQELEEKAKQKRIIVAPVSDETDDDNLAVLGLGPAYFKDLDSLLGKSYPVLS
mmetsp:Transcript_7286/g.9230  ORF Transcript_7286/g.9230 Transcript_7286/m.9230 type:complete len:102 (-) Transcript_7286:989-1294(-)